jgi:hypothetical protein
MICISPSSKVFDKPLPIRRKKESRLRERGSVRHAHPLLLLPSALEEGSSGRLPVGFIRSHLLKNPSRRRFLVPNHAPVDDLRGHFIHSNLRLALRQRLRYRFCWLSSGRLLLRHAKLKGHLAVRRRYPITPTGASEAWAQAIVHH